MPTETTSIERVHLTANQCAPYDVLTMSGKLIDDMLLIAANTSNIKYLSNEKRPGHF